MLGVQQLKDDGKINLEEIALIFGNDDDKMFIIFFVDPDVKNLSENNKKSDEEYLKLTNTSILHHKLKIMIG